MKRKLFVLAAMTACIAAGGAFAQTTSATSKNAPNPDYVSEDERMMYEGNADILGGFFTDDTMATMKSEQEVRETFAALGKEDQDQIKAACDRVDEMRGSYGTVTQSLCAQVNL